MKTLQIIGELISFLLQVSLCFVIIGIALPFIILKVIIELSIDSLSEASFIKRIRSHRKMYENDSE
jgi:hypothetical protein